MNDVVPKDRDIAMVFQNYALYPHMSVYDNMAFGLKLRKVPKDVIDEKVKAAADILGIRDYLVDIKFARRNFFETCDHTQRRGLTAAGRTDEYDELFIPNIKAKVEYCLISAGINFVDAGNTLHRISDLSPHK